MISFVAVGFVGVLLGVFGGGGSLLILPLLVYLVGLSPVEATSYSLLIVGVAALIGAVDFLRKGLVNFSSVLGFGFPSIVGVFLTRTVLMHQIPDQLIDSESFSLSKNTLVMGVFCIMVLGSSYSMIRKRPERDETSEHRQRLGITILAGFIVGLLTGFVGAGGGFLIVPALMFLLHLPVREAVATSLFVIALKSVLGFLGDTFMLDDIEWWLLLKLTVAAVIGILLGVRLNRRIPAEKLKTSFGWVVLLMGGLILVREFLLPA